MVLGGASQTVSSRENQALQRLISLIEKRSGNLVPERNRPFLLELMRRRALANGSCLTYVRELERDESSPEWGEIVSLVTVNESFFYRTPAQLDAFIDRVVPEIVAARSAGEDLEFWSAGCARGEEPATLAMLLKASPVVGSRRWRILGTDVDQSVLIEARSGLYHPRLVSRLPDHLRDRYFSKVGTQYRLAEVIRERVDYHSLNLTEVPFPHPGKLFDVIFCRNVLIYFPRDLQQLVVENLAESLRRDGWLFVGPSETLWRLTDCFEPVELDGCFAYRRVQCQATSGGVGEALMEGDELDDSAVAKAEEPPPPGAIEIAFEALEGGRVDEAHELVQALVKSQPQSLEARALEALVLEELERYGEAIKALRAALYLEPEASALRLHLAQSLERGGWPDRAVQEYRRVLETIGRPGHRVVTLGGLEDEAETITKARAALARLG